MLGKGWRRALPGFAISAIVLAAVFAFTDTKRLWASLKQIPLPVLLGAAALLAVSLGLRATAWRLLLGARIGWWDAFWALNLGYLVNNIIPFRAGEAMRALVASPKAKVSFWHALSTVVVERLFDVVLLAGMLIGSLPWVLDLPWARRTSWAFGGGALAILAALAAAAIWRTRVALWLRHLEEKARNSLLKTLVNWGLSFLDGLEALASPWSLLAVVTLMVLSWAVQVVAYWMTLRALVPTAPMVWAAFVLGSVGMGVAVPSAPGGLGVMEGVVVFVLSAVGVDSAVALAFAFAMHAVYYAVTVIFGWVGATIYGVSIHKLTHITHSRPTT